MRMEYLPDGATDCPLIRLFRGSSEDVLELVRRFEELSGAERLLRLHELPFITPVRGVEVTAGVSETRIGVMADGTNAFRWLQTFAGWAEIADLARPFTDPTGPQRHAWLDENSEISVLISSSQDGTW